MWRRIFSCTVLALGAAASQAQVPVQSGYVVIRVKTALDPSTMQPGGMDPSSTSPYSSGPPTTTYPGSGSDGMPPGFPGSTPGGTGQPPPPPDVNQSVVAVVHYKNIENRLVYPKNQPSQANPPLRMLRTDLGNAFLYADNKTVEMYWLPPNANYDKLVTNTAIQWASRGKPAKDGVDLVALALQHGMVDEAVKYAGQTVESIESRKTETQPAPIAKFVAAFKAVAPKLTAGGVDTGEAEKWRDRLQAAQVEQSPHYALVTWGEQSVGQNTVRSRLDQLERNFKAFFLWHALNGVELQVPEAKLVAVLADRSSSVNRLRDALDGLPVVTDAFYSPLHQLLVLSPQRMDDVGRNFSRIVETKYRSGWNRDELLKGIGPLLQRGETVLPVVEAMTYSLVDKAVEETAAQAMITREGTRQLYSACGLLPRHVVMPEWVNHGSGNLFYKPKNAFYTNETAKTPTMTVGLNAGYGAANYVFFRQFKQFQSKGELNPDAGELLLNVLSDKYFDAARDGKDIDPKPKASPENVGIKIGGQQPGAQPGFPGGQPGPYPMGLPPGSYPMDGSGYPMSGVPGQPAPDPAKEKRELAQKLESKAQVTSWALMFYLAKNRMPELIKFYGELSRMPRDMRLDRGLVVRTFCKCFGLMNASKPDEYDRDAVNSFAQGWLAFVGRYPQSGYDLRMELTPITSSGPGPMGAGPMESGSYPMPPGANMP